MFTDALNVLFFKKDDKGDVVNIIFLYAFGAVNLVVSSSQRTFRHRLFRFSYSYCFFAIQIDIISTYLFCRNKDAFVTSLDRNDFVTSLNSDNDNRFSRLVTHEGAEEMGDSVNGTMKEVVNVNMASAFSHIGGGEFEA